MAECFIVRRGDVTITGGSGGGSGGSTNYVKNGLIRFWELKTSSIESITNSILPSAEDTITYDYDETLKRSVGIFNSNAALRFENTSTTPIYTEQLSNFTISCLARTNDITKRLQTFFCLGTSTGYEKMFSIDAQSLSGSTQGRVCIDYYGSQTWADKNIEQDKWYQFTATYNSNHGVKLYINGELSIYTTFSTSVDSRIGAIGTVAGNYNSSFRLDGSACDYRIYNRELTTEEIIQNWRAARCEYFDDSADIPKGSYVPNNLTFSGGFSGGTAGHPNATVRILNATMPCNMGSTIECCVKVNTIPKNTGRALTVCNTSTGDTGSSRMIIAPTNVSAANVAADADFACNYTANLTGRSEIDTYVTLPGVHYGEVHTYTLAVDEGVVKFYLDGELLTSEYTINQASPTFQTIGTMYGLNRTDRTLTGEMYHFRVYSRALTAEEVVINYNADKINFNSGS